MLKTKNLWSMFNVLVTRCLARWLFPQPGTPRRKTRILYPLVIFERILWRSLFCGGGLFGVGVLFWLTGGFWSFGGFFEVIFEYGTAFAKGDLDSFSNFIFARWMSRTFGAIFADISDSISIVFSTGI